MTHKRLSRYERYHLNTLNREAMRNRIVNALLSNAPILKLRWRTILADIRKRYSCSQELAHEALSEVHAVRPRT